MFDDGSIDARNFTIVSLNELGEELCDHMEYVSIQKYYSIYVPEIIKAFKAGKHHVTFNEGTDSIIEFQWD